MNRLFSLLLVTLLAISFVSCNKDKGTDPDPYAEITLTEDYFPMEDGDIWFYTFEGNKRVIRHIDGDTMIVNDTAKRVRDSVYFNTLLLSDSTKQVWSKDNSQFNLHIIDAVILPQPKLYIPFGLTKGQSHYYNSLIYFIINDSLIGGDERLVGKLTNLGGISKTVPAGAFTDVIVLHYDDSLPSVGSYNEYYAPGVGLIDNGDLVLDSAHIGGVWYRP